MIVDARSIPSLSDRKGWIPYHLQQNPNNSKLDKKPAERGWQNSKESLAECLARTRHNPDLHVGLVLNPDTNRLILIDFDNVRFDGDMTAEAASYVNKANTFAEVSVSGKGIHCLATASIHKDYKHKYQLNRGGCELYWKDRFVAITGDHLESTPTEISEIDNISELLPFLAVKKKDRDYTQKSVTGLFYGNAKKYPITKAPYEGLIECLNKAKNRAKFWKLFNGIYIHDGAWLPTKNYPTQSEGDLGLISLCMYYAKSEHFLEKYYQNLDRTDIRGLAYSLCDIVLKKSALNRPKWKRLDYRISTLHLAYESQINVYDPVAYFQEHYSDDFSELQRFRQGLSASSRVSNNNKKIMSAILTLKMRGDKLTYTAIENESGVKRQTVSSHLKAMGFSLK